MSGRGVAVEDHSIGGSRVRRAAPCRVVPGQGEPVLSGDPGGRDVEVTILVIIRKWRVLHSFAHGEAKFGGDRLDLAIVLRRGGNKVGPEMITEVTGMAIEVHSRRGKLRPAGAEEER